MFAFNATNIQFKLGHGIAKAKASVKDKSNSEYTITYKVFKLTHATSYLPTAKLLDGNVINREQQKNRGPQQRE